MPEDLKRHLQRLHREIDAVHSRVDREAGDILVELLLHRPAIFVAGAGRSGLLARCFAMRLCHLGLPVRLTDDTLSPPIRAGDLLVAVSGSGETATLVAKARKALSTGAELALVTANPDSTLAAMARVAVVMAAPSKDTPHTDAVSIQPMGSLFEQSAFLYLEALVMVLMQRLRQTPADMLARHANLE